MFLSRVGKKERLDGPFRCSTSTEEGPEGEGSQGCRIKGVRRSPFSEEAYFRGPPKGVESYFRFTDRKPTPDTPDPLRSGTGGRRMERGGRCDWRTVKKLWGL